MRLKVMNHTQQLKLPYPINMKKREAMKTLKLKVMRLIRSDMVQNILPWFMIGLTLLIYMNRQK
jgi:hypothetical protein